MRILMLLAILIASFSVFAVTPRIVDPFAGSQYEAEQVDQEANLVATATTVRLERIRNVTGETTQPISYEEVKCYKPVYRVGLSVPVEVGWQF